ncbi:MAG: hypothetical protein GC153_06100 [Alphaproteobacteria bacterium]|nr:hypothetical protein [Alphaproteobacteria bacterium]
MALQKRQCKIDRAGGEIVIELRAQKAQPMEGVLSTLRGQVVGPEPKSDESVVVWRLSPREISGCVFYGVVTPMGRLWGAPKYERRISQDGQLLTGLPNPALFTTHKLHPGEYVGPPEAVRFI